MSVDPYRSRADLAPRDGGPAELFYTPETTTMFVEGCLPFVLAVVVGGIGGVLTSHLLLGLSLGGVVGMLVGAVQRRKSDAAGILFRVRHGVLTIGRGKRGRRPIAEATLGDVLDVKIENETLLASIGNLVAGPSFGMDPPDGRHRGATVEESRIAVVLRSRAEPIHLTTDRVSNIDATDWLERIHGFLRAHGWRPLHEKVESANEPMTILATSTDGAEYTITATMQASAFVLEAKRLGPREGEVATSEYVIRVEDLPAFTKRLLEASGDADRYEELERGERLVELVRDVFVIPHGISSINELTQWLDREGIPFGYSRG